MFDCYDYHFALVGEEDLMPRTNVSRDRSLTQHRSAYNLVVKLAKLDFYAHGSSTSTFNHHDGDGQSYIVVCYAKKSANGSLYGFYLQFSIGHSTKLNSNRSPKSCPRFVEASVSMNIPELKISSERKNVAVLTNERRGTVFLKWIPKDRLVDLEYVKVNITDLKLSLADQAPTNVPCCTTSKNPTLFGQSKSQESIVIENNCDEQDLITLISSDSHKFKFSRLGLIKTSPIFAAMLKKASGSNLQSMELFIDDIDSTILSSFLRFADGGIISDLDKESIIDGRTDHLSGLLYAGHKYMVDDLVQTCTSFMQFWMSDKNVEHFLNLSNIYDVANLKNCALDFMQCRK